VSGMAGRLGVADKVGLASRIWLLFLRVAMAVRSRPLPQVIEGMRPGGSSERLAVQPVRLGRIVERVLRIGPWKARCLFTSLVLYRLLLEHGEDPEFVIGLPREPKDKDAHAWIELDGVDVGPPPGRSGHEELARYG
jgi:hypothetical protein